jgi:hypothetical protein
VKEDLDSGATGDTALDVMNKLQSESKVYAALPGAVLCVCACVLVCGE